MKIGELSRRTGTSIETIRYYEREKLLPDPERTASNYRLYGESHVERLGFIRHCRSLDMALGEIRVLLRFKESPQDDCTGVNALLDEHIGHVADRIRELRALEKQLKQLRQQCTHPDSAGGCGILRELSDATASSTAPRKPNGHVHGAH